VGAIGAAQDRELVGGWGRGGSSFQKLRFLICAIFSLTLSVLYIYVFYFTGLSIDIAQARELRMRG
jgi:hypothetical protein